MNTMYGEVFIISGVGMMISAFAVLILTIRYIFAREKTLSMELLDDYGSVICEHLPRQKQKA